MNFVIDDSEEMQGGFPTDTVTWPLDQCIEVFCYLEKPCDCGWCDTENGHNGGCSVCNGAGYVLLFPTLREECPCLLACCRLWMCQQCTLTGKAFHNDNPCSACQGRGWLPNVTLEGLLEALLRAADSVDLRTGAQCWVVDVEVYGGDYAMGDGETPLLALARGVCTAYGRGNA